MFRAFFGALTTGRLARLPFIGYWVLLWVLFMLYGLGIAFGIGLLEPLIFEDLEAARGYLLANFAPPVLAAFALFCLLFVFGQFNLVAKRIRDMGLPGWSVLLLIALLGGGLGYALPPGGDLMRLENQVNGAFNGILVLALLVIPGGLFGRRVPPASAADPLTDAVPESVSESVVSADGDQAPPPRPPVAVAMTDREPPATPAALAATRSAPAASPAATERPVE